MSGPSPSGRLRIAFVHDWLIGMRGGEKVLEEACRIFPQADIYTLLYDRDLVSDEIRKRRVVTSWMQHLPGVRRYYRYLLPLMPSAIRSLDLSGYDLVISFSHCVAKGAKKASGALHLCYCFTPMRYVYYQFDNYFPENSNPLIRKAVEWIRPYLVSWDQRTTREVDHFAANSENVQRRIQKTYGRDAVPIYSPVDTEFYTPASGDAPRGSYYLVAGALVPYKRMDLAVEACKKLGLPLKVVGIGSEESRLREMARGAAIEFLGWQSNESLRKLYQDCEAFLFPQEEDFGIAALEAMACGRPVIAYKAGGALETVVGGKTGVFFEEQSADSLAEAIARSRGMRFDSQEIRRHALKFDRRHFLKQFADFVDQAVAGRRALHNGAASGGKIRVLEVVECGGAGGTGNQVAAICNGLDPARFEIGLAFAVRPGDSPHEYERLVHGASRRWHVPEMVREITPLSDLRAWLRLYRIFREFKPQIVHAHSSKAGFLARTAARAAGVPRIFYTPHGYSFLQTDRSPASRLFYRWLERWASKIGTVVAVSPSEAQLARSIRAREVRVVQDAYLGSLPDAVEARKDSLVVCASGRLGFARNPEAFVRLARRLTDSRNGLRCLWIGGGELEPLVKEMIQDMNLSGKLELTGWLSHEQALARMRGADILVHFSRWEGLPNVVLEAMAAGLPVLASDVPGNRDLVRSGENGFLVSSEIELLERTLELVDDPALRLRLGERGRALVRSEYSAERMLREISELYLG